MSLMRAIVVALTALSIALLPVAGAHALVLVPQTSHLAVTAECCPEGQHCEHQRKGDCGQTECLSKCSNLSANQLEDSGAPLGPLDQDKAMRMAGTAKTQSPHPPSPPPRA